MLPPRTPVSITWSIKGSFCDGHAARLSSSIKDCVGALTGAKLRQKRLRPSLDCQSTNNITRDFVNYPTGVDTVFHTVVVVDLIDQVVADWAREDAL